MALPPAEPLFEHLVALRDSTHPLDPAHGHRWRAIDDWMSRAFPGADEDARQNALIGLMRHVGTMRAEAPLQAAKWVSTILRRKHVDHIRARDRDPVRSALRAERAHPTGFG